MAHERLRQVLELYKKLIAASPIVGIFGHRQVGKTTLANQISGHYLTFDLRQLKNEAEKDPSVFLKNHAPKAVGRPPLVLDECQLVPDLFSALKEYVRQNKRPGQFLLTGSVRFTSTRAIRESLAGRILSVELFPLIVSELSQSPFPDLLNQCLKVLRFDVSFLTNFPNITEQQKSQKALQTYLKNGGLPGLCFLRNERLRIEGLRAVHQLILDRDLRLITETRISLETLNEFLTEVAGLGLNPYSYARISKTVGISIATQKSLIFALESIFLVRRIKLIGKKGFFLLMEDQFEEYHLSKGKHPLSTQLLTAFYRNARAQFAYRLGMVHDWSSYWLNSGARVPLVLSHGDKQLGFLIIEEEKPSLSQKRSAMRFLSQFPDGKIIYLSPAAMKPVLFEDRIMACSIASLV